MQNKMLKKIASIAAVLSVALVTMPSADVLATSSNFSPSHTVDKQTAKPGDVLTYTLKIKGTGNSENIVAGTHLSDFVELVANSTKATKGSNVVSIPDVWVNNYNFGVLTTGQTITITYQAKIKGNATNNQLVETTALVGSKEYPAKVHCAAKTIVKIEETRKQYSPSKTVDKEVAKRGDVLNYTLKAVNTGNVTLTNFYILDQLPTSGVTYIPGSTRLIRGTSNVKVADSWIKDGANTGDLKPGATVIITFQVKVNNDAPNGLDLENVGNFRSTELPTWMRCAVHTIVKVDHKPTPTPSSTPTPTPTPTPTGEVLGATPTPTVPPVAELPSTGPGLALVASLGGIVSALWGRKYFLSR